MIKEIVRPDDLGIIVDNIGVDNGFSAVYTSNAAMHTGFVQVGLKPDHRIGSYEYIRQIKKRMAQEMPEITPFFSTGSLVDAVVSMGAPAPIDVQIVGANLDADNNVAQDIASKLRLSPEIADVFMPQDLDYPSLRVDIDRLHAAKLGLTEREVLTNVITSLTSNQMIAPNLWIDPRNGNNYFLTVQYPEAQIRSIQDLRSIPLHADGVAAANAPGHDRQHRAHQGADGSGPLSDPPQARHLCAPVQRESRRRGGLRSQRDCARRKFRQM